MPSGVYDRNQKLTDEERKKKKKMMGKVYEQTHAVKERRKKRQQTPDAIIKQREYYQKNKEKIKAKSRIQNKNTKSKITAKTYASSERGKVAKKKANAKYNSSEKGKKWRGEWISSEKGKDVLKKSAKKFKSTEKAKILRQVTIKNGKITGKSRRLRVMQHYSKLHSNSNIPCCRCCGLNSTIEFLALDHIAGRWEMDSEPELKKLGYSSTKKDQSLTKWIMDNNYPKGFQILCHNCNFTKGMKKNNNKCPMENKPH
jgi:hypothetical protein